MNKTFKRLTTMLLAVVMLVGCMGVTAFAETDTLQKAVVKYSIDGSDTVAAGMEFTEELKWMNLAGSLLPEAEVEGKELAGWKDAKGTEYAPGAKLTWADMAALVGDNFDAEGQSIVTFYAVLEEVVAPVELAKVNMHFTTNGSDEAAASVTFVEADEWQVLAGSVYSEKEQEGKVLDGWKLFGTEKTFAPGQKLTWDDVVALVGDNMTAEGEANLTFDAFFETVEAPEEPIELSKVVLHFTTNGSDEAAAPITFVAADDWMLLAGSVYAEAEQEGKVLDAWKLFGTENVYKPGQKITWADVVTLVGDNMTAEGEAHLTFDAIFEAIETPSTPSQGGSSSGSTGGSNVYPSYSADDDEDDVVVDDGIKDIPQTGSNELAIVMVAALVAAVAAYVVLSRKARA